MREVTVLPGTERRRLRRLKELPVAAVDREGERALGELDARLVKHQAVGTRLVDDLCGFLQFFDLESLKKSSINVCSTTGTSPSLHS